MRQVVKLLRLEQICLPDLKVSPTAVQEHSDVLHAQELEDEKHLRRFAWRRVKVEIPGKNINPCPDYNPIAEHSFGCAQQQQQ